MCPVTRSGSRWAVLRSGHQGRFAWRHRVHRAGKPGRWLRRRHSARGLGPRRQLDRARCEATGLAPRVIKAELTIAPVNPAMADLIPLHEKSYADALAEIDTLWAATEAAA